MKLAISREELAKLITNISDHPMVEDFYAFVAKHHLSSGQVVPVGLKLSFEMTIDTLRNDFSDNIPVPIKYLKRSEEIVIRLAWASQVLPLCDILAPGFADVYRAFEASLDSDIKKNQG